VSRKRKYNFKTKIMIKLNKAITLIVMMLCVSCFAQNRKEQISHLQINLDSLRTIHKGLKEKIIKDSIFFNDKIFKKDTLLKQQKNYYEIKIAKLEFDIDTIITINNKLKLDLEKKNLEIISLNQTLNSSPKSYSTNLDDFIGIWLLPEDSSGALANFEINNDKTISFSGGPCQGTLQYTLINNILELVYRYSECNYSGFNNKNIVGKKIGVCFIENGELVLDLTVGDDLLSKGKTIFHKEL
jgi:hypothetical protein